MNRSIMQYQQDGLNQLPKENNLDQSVVSPTWASCEIVARGDGWVMTQFSDGQLKTLTIE